LRKMSFASGLLAHSRQLLPLHPPSFTNRAASRLFFSPSLALNQPAGARWFASSRLGHRKKKKLKIILREDVPKLGAPGDLVEVKRGYGRNYLIPFKKAVYATPENLSLAKLQSPEELEARAAAAAKAKADESARKRIDRIALTFLRTKDATTRRLKREITAETIANALERKHKIDLFDSEVVMPEKTSSISSFGSHVVGLRLPGTSSPVPLKVHVMPSSSALKEQLEPPRKKSSKLAASTTTTAVA